MREQCWVLCIVYRRASNVTFKRIIPRLVTPWNNLPTCLLHGIRPLSPLLYCLWFQLWRRGYLCHMSLRRKIYWTDGNTINMASMDGSNSKVLHQNQRDPVGQYESSGPHADGELLVSCVSDAACSILDAVLRWSLPKRTFVFICVWSRPSAAADEVIWMRMPYYIDGAGSVQEYVSVRVKVNFTLAVVLVPVDARRVSTTSAGITMNAHVRCLPGTATTVGVKLRCKLSEVNEGTPGNKEELYVLGFYGVFINATRFQCCRQTSKTHRWLSTYFLGLFVR